MEPAADFPILLDFLGRFGPEVTGHDLSIPQATEAETLLRFAHGDCNEAERVKACRLLRQNPTWIRWLADHVKLARPSASPSKSRSQATASA
jgi:hypothetical protein